MANDKETLEFEFDLGPNKPKKIHRGAYNFIKNDSVYAEESFEVYRDKKELTLNFVSNMLSRVSTGELLKIQVNYQVSKDFVPLKVIVKKDLGREKVEESYKFDTKKNLLNYTFKNKRAKHTDQINTPPRFHIFTPSACCSMLFLLSKKFDTTAKNFYTSIQSINQWDYEHELIVKTVCLERISLTSESINIGGNELQAVQYRLFEDIRGQEAAKDFVKPPSLKVYQSRHNGVPYSINSEDGTMVQIKFFHNLEDD